MKKILLAIAVIMAMSNAYSQKQIQVNVGLFETKKIEKKSYIELQDSTYQNFVTTYRWNDTTVRDLYTVKNIIVKTRVTNMVRYIDDEGFVRTKVCFANGTSRTCDPDNGNKWFNIGQYVEYEDEKYIWYKDTVITPRVVREVKKDGYTVFYNGYTNCKNYRPTTPSYASVEKDTINLKTKKEVEIEYYDTTSVLTYGSTDLYVICVEKCYRYPTYGIYNAEHYQMRVYSKTSNKYYTVRISKSLYEKYEFVNTHWYTSTRKQMVEKGIRLEYKDLLEINYSPNYHIDVNVTKIAA